LPRARSLPGPPPSAQGAIPRHSPPRPAPPRSWGNGQGSPSRDRPNTTGTHARLPVHQGTASQDLPVRLAVRLARRLRAFRALRPSRGRRPAPIPLTPPWRDRRQPRMPLYRRRHGAG
jgi:hypothetical protein